MANTSLTTIRIPDFVYDLNIYPLSIKEEDFSSADYVRKLRSRTWGRYEEEIGKALDNLFKKSKQEWPRLLRS